MLGTVFRLLLGLAVSSFCAVLVCTEWASALPLEKFEHKMEVACQSPGVCARSLRSQAALGSYTGIAWRGVGEGKGTLAVDKGMMSLSASSGSAGSLTLTWDGDTSAEQLSGAGLGCLDVRRGGASALVVKDLSVNGRCSTDEGDECPPFVVETRLYDFADPTGQTYSASMLRRANEKPSGDLVIPFSNLNRRGPRGAGRIDCVGAISITVRMERYSDVTLSMGPIFTNSEDPMAVPPTPTPTFTAVVATPLIERYGGVTPVASNPTVLATETSSPIATGIKDSPTPAVVSTRTEVVKGPALEEAIVAPRGAPQASVEPTPQEEEVIFGQVVVQ